MKNYNTMPEILIFLCDNKFLMNKIKIKSLTKKKNPTLTK